MEKTVMQMIKGRFDASKDYYLRNTPDQPKLAIANYVRQNGVLVPENTLDLAEALDYIKKKPDSDDICRSECEQDYYGSCGHNFDSHILKVSNPAFSI